MKIITLLLLINLPATLFSQFADMTELENDLCQRYQKMTQFIGNFDSVAVYSDEFTDTMNAYIASYPQTLNYSFTRLRSIGIAITTSDNGNFRIYSWDTWTGGTMHFFRTVHQYKTDKGIYCQAVQPGEGDPGCFCSGIFTVTATSGIYYLAINNGVFSSKDVAQWVQAFTIQNNSLNDSVKLFKTDDSLANTIIIEFDFFSVVDHPERPLKLIDYNPETKTLSVPIIVGYGQVSNKKKRYRFSGAYFK